MSLRGLKVLILEDEPLIAVDLECAVRAHDALPTLASTIDAGAALLERGAFDACVLDLWLKGQSVDSLIDAMDRKGIPYAIYSGWSLPVAMRSRVYVAKPRPVDDVIDALCTLITKVSV